MTPSPARLREMMGEVKQSGLSLPGEPAWPIEQAKHAGIIRALQDYEAYLPHLLDALDARDRRIAELEAEAQHMQCREKLLKQDAIDAADPEWRARYVVEIERVIAGLNKQLTEQFELSTKYVALAGRYQEALTPSGDTKAAYIGEFKFPVCHIDEDGDEAWHPTPVPWDTIKEIMAAIRARADLDRRS